MEPKEQRKVDEFIVYRDVRGDARRSSDAGWKPTSYEEQTRTGVMIGSGIGGIEGIAETAIIAEGEGAAPRLAVLHSRAA